MFDNVFLHCSCIAFCLCIAHISLFIITMLYFLIMGTVGNAPSVVLEVDKIL